ncbi:class I SAM-dependent methyltransferase [Acinetobacter sp. c1-l78]|uniref:class I SAM-dependent methyltransferase n=1 Tax=Acinetobacter sp. c1-l78 TaxID=3342803 RepID=UPI0035B6C1AA
MLNLYSLNHLHAQAQYWQEQYCALSQQPLNVIFVENINIKFLRQNPELSLILDDDGLHLAWNSMKMQPAWQDEIYRLKHANTKNELLAHACYQQQGQNILDCTAGLGHDGLLLASLGLNVTLIERHPILYLLLLTTWQNALHHPQLKIYAERMHIVHAESADYLTQIQPKQYDVIYLDPMFPQRDANQKQAKKQAQVKKQMQVLHHLLSLEHEIDLGENLLSLAQAKSKRVIVKRPRHAEALNQQMPQHQWLGDAVRFDGYFQLD